jgi:hypothetical protein
MMNQMKMLLRVKQLKEEQAFRQVNIKRAQVAQARQQLEAAEAAIRASAAALPEQEAAIWAEVMRRVIALPTIDTVKARVKALQDAHLRLVDAGARARHVLARVEKELSEAIDMHRAAVRTRDKYVVLRDEVVAEWRNLQDQKEEAEVEDLFSTPRKRLA